MKARAIGAPDKTVRPVPIYEAMAEPKAVFEWVSSGLLAARGIALLAAAGGVGKSTLAAQICAGIAAGKGILGLELSAGATLFLEAEGSRERFMAGKRAEP